MLFKYKAIDKEGSEKTGSIDAINEDIAITSLQRRGLMVMSIKAQDGEDVPFFQKNLSIFQRVSNKEIVILSRQISTLFDAQVSALKSFTFLASESENPLLRKKLTIVADDIQRGVSLSSAMSKHPELFSDFYVNMVSAGEETGKLNQTFLYLASYLDRAYELISKTRNALVYPAFVSVVFVIVMILMLVMVIPRLSSIILETGQEIPIYTKIVIGLSESLISYGFLMLGLLAVVGVSLWKYGKSKKGKLAFSTFKLNIPYIGDLFRKLYLSRIADNMDTMLTSGISMVRALEITGRVVGNGVYEEILAKSLEEVKGGKALSSSLEGYEEIPNIMIQMMKIGEETGELGPILKTLAGFYKREVDNSVDTLVGLIEPLMIVMLALGVGFLLTSVLMPIYNISSGI